MRGAAQGASHCVTLRHTGQGWQVLGSRARLSSCMQRGSGARSHPPQGQVAPPLAAATAAAASGIAGWRAVASSAQHRSAVPQADVAAPLHAPGRAKWAATASPSRPHTPWRRGTAVRRQALRRSPAAATTRQDAYPPTRPHITAPAAHTSAPMTSPAAGEDGRDAAAAGPGLRLTASPGRATRHAPTPHRRPTPRRATPRRPPPPARPGGSAPGDGRELLATRSPSPTLQPTLLNARLRCTKHAP